MAGKLQAFPGVNPNIIASEFRSRSNSNPRFDRHETQLSNPHCCRATFLQGYGEFSADYE